MKAAICAGGGVVEADIPLDEVERLEPLTPVRTVIRMKDGRRIRSVDSVERIVGRNQLTVEEEAE